MRETLDSLPAMLSTKQVMAVTGLSRRQVGENLGAFVCHVTAGGKRFFSLTKLRAMLEGSAPVDSAPTPANRTHGSKTAR